jgi:CheY-like chemotaxis protein
MNYTSCQKYIQLLKTMGWVREDRERGSEEVLSITEMGKLMLNRLTLFLGSGSDSSSDAESLLLLSKELLATRDNAITENSTNSATIGNLVPGNRSPKTRNIMVIDDERDVLVTYESILKHAGYNVEAYSDPEVALKRLAVVAQSYYQLLIMDIRMPKINGIQLYQRVKLINPTTKMIFVSSLDAARELASILPGIIDSDILKKPVGKRQLIAKVEQSVGALN